MARHSASSIAPAVCSWIAQTRRARVLSVFGRLCNLINDRGEVVAIVSPAVGNGPFHIVLDEPVAFSSFLDMDALIAVHAEEISLADTVIDLRGSALWTAAPHWPELHALRGHITQRLRDLGEWIQSRAPTGSMIQSQSEDAIRESPPYPYHVDRVSHRLGMTGLGILAMRRPANELSAAVAAADPVTCQRAARQLAGSGSGLTPAGDDYLVGAIYAAWILLAPDEAATIARALVQVAAPLTTSLSAAWLQAAARGEAGEVWHALFAALAHAENRAVQAAIESLFMMGHTSGADALAGFRGTLQTWAESELVPCLSRTS